MKKAILIIGATVTLILAVLWYFDIVSEPLVAIGTGVLTVVGYIFAPANNAKKTTIKQKHSGEGDNVAGDKNEGDNYYLDGSGNVVIQDAKNANITINSAENLETEIKEEASIYLTVIAAIPDFGSNAVLWGVTITNLSKEQRYFNQPYFKVSPKFELEAGLEDDTFMMFSQERVQFPVRLEYGQTLNLTFEVNPNQFALFEKNSTKKDAILTAYCTTTVGGLYNSNDYRLDKFVKDYEAIKKVVR